MAISQRSRPSDRLPSEPHSESESSSSTERPNDDDTDFFMLQANDSQSSLGVGQYREMGAVPDEELEEVHQKSPISRLPPELLISIFARLTSTSDLRNCMLVSHHWAAYAVGILWHRPACNSITHLQSVAHSLASNRASFPYYELVRRLNLSALKDKVNDGTVQPFGSCKRVERLTLTSCSNLTDHGVAALIEGNKHLQALDVTELGSLTDHTFKIVADNCPRLQGLNLTNCKKVTDESLIPVSQNCRQLKRLKLNQCVLASDRAIQSFAANCPSILEIDLHACQNISSPSITALMSQLPHLRELRLAHCARVTDDAFTSLSRRMMFDSLRILDLTACELIEDAAICHIIPQAPRLRNLVLAKCRQITDKAISAICRLGKNLHYIHLGHCQNISDDAVIQLVKACNRIRYIDLACCNKLTDDSVKHLAQLPKLRRVGLVKCQQLTDRSILALARGPTPGPLKSPVPRDSSLERVHLSYCVNLTIQGVHQLLQACPRLTHLSLTGVQAFHARDDLTRFCREAPSEFTNLQRDVFCVFSGDGVSRLREYLNAKADEERLIQPDDIDDDDISVEDDNEHGGVVVTVGGHTQAGVPVVVVGAGGQIVQTMYQPHTAQGDDDDEEGIYGDDEQDGDAVADVNAMTGSMQMTGIADPMPVDGPPRQQNDYMMNHDMTQ